LGAHNLRFSEFSQRLEFSEFEVFRTRAFHNVQFAEFVVFMERFFPTLQHSEFTIF